MACVWRADENAGNLKSVVQVFISRIINFYVRSKDLEVLTFNCNQ